MARSNAKPQAVRGEHQPKAGKKKSFKQPPPVNPAKKEAREYGRQQFIAKEQLTVPGTKIVFDAKIQQFVTKIVAVSVPCLYDATRKQYVYSPSIAEKEEKA